MVGLTHNFRDAQGRCFIAGTPVHPDAYAELEAAWAVVDRLADGIREHSCGISKGCYCTWDEDGNPIGKHSPNCFQPFEAERRLKSLLDVAGDDQPVPYRALEGSEGGEDG